MYLRGIRRHMDANTGLVGVIRKVSLRSLAESVAEAPDWGSTRREGASLPSTAEVRAALAQLERHGLIERVEKTNRFQPIVFKCPIASQGLIRLKKERQRNDKGGTTSNSLYESTTSNPGATKERQGRNNIHHKTIIKNNNNNPPIIPPAKKRPARLPDDFTVTQDMREWAKDKVPRLNVQNETEHFVDHHMAKGSTYVDWTRAWQTWMRNANKWARGDNGQTRKLSGIEAIRAANRRREAEEGRVIDITDYAEGR